MTAFLRGLLAALLVSAALLGAGARPAVAATPCWKALLNDWYDGRIDHTYPIRCYTDALKHLPTDVQTYSSAHDDIERALQSARTHDRKLHRRDGPGTLVPPSGTKSEPPSGPGAAPTTTLPGNRPKGGIASLADRLNPASPSALPVPLLVLGGLALLLVAAGGIGVAAKRFQNRP